MLAMMPPLQDQLHIFLSSFLSLLALLLPIRSLVLPFASFGFAGWSGLFFSLAINWLIQIIFESELDFKQTSAFLSHSMTQCRIKHSPLVSISHPFIAIGDFFSEKEKKGLSVFNSSFSAQTHTYALCKHTKCLIYQSLFFIQRWCRG